MSKEWHIPRTDIKSPIIHLRRAGKAINLSEYIPVKNNNEGIG